MESRTQTSTDHAEAPMEVLRLSYHGLNLAVIEEEIDVQRKLTLLLAVLYLMFS